MSSRRQARERALGLLYESEARGQAPSEVLASLAAAPDPFASRLVAGVESRAAEVDRLIRRYSVDWAPERMPVVDRCILRLAVWELLETGTPVAAVISEAVELAKAYSTESSGRFVNGVLASVAAEVRGPAAEAGPSA
jgi:N utilization substance protein B